MELSAHLSTRMATRCKRFLETVVLIAPILCVLGACSAKKEKPGPKPPVPVAVAVSSQKTVPVQIRAIGNIEPFNTVSIKAQINGQIARVHFREGQDVRKGDLLFTIDPRPFQAALKQAEATLAKDMAQAKFSREQAQRYGTLIKDGIVTQDQYDQLRTNADAFDATIAADRAAVENAGIQLSYCYIRSPINGRTGNLAVQLGNLVKANDLPVLVTINQVSPIYATFTVPEKELPEIKKRMAAGELKVEAQVPQDQASEKGSVSFLDNTIDPATGMIKLKGVFTNQSRKLWPGQFVNVVMTLSTLPNAVVVAQQAVQTGQTGQYVFVMKEDKTVEQRAVTTGVSFGGESVVLSGLKPGETVIVDGQMRLVPGAKVEVKNAVQGSNVAAADSVSNPTAATPGSKR